MDTYEIINLTSSSCACGAYLGQYHRPDCSSLIDDKPLKARKTRIVGMHRTEKIDSRGDLKACRGEAGFNHTNLKTDDRSVSAREI